MTEQTGKLDLIFVKLLADSQQDLARAKANYEAMQSVSLYNWQFVLRVAGLPENVEINLGTGHWTVPAAEMSDSGANPEEKGV